MVGTEVALYLAEKDKNVTIIEMLDEIMKDAATTDKIVYQQKIQENNVKIFTGEELEEIKDNKIITVSKEGKKEYKADNVVLACGFKPNDNIISKLNENYDTYSIGDCNNPAKIFDAIHTAYITARKI